MPGADPSDPGRDIVVDFEIERPPVVRAMPRHAAPADSGHRRVLDPGPVIADGIAFARNGQTILQGVSVHVRPGESLAVVGPSGSGKSTLLALLAGLEEPDSGTIPRTTRRQGLVLQGYGLVNVLTAAENVEVPLQAGVRGCLDPAAIRRSAAHVLESVGLAPVAEHLIEELSGGQQQRVAIGRALVIDPDVVFADEVTAELDREWKDTVVELVLDVARRGGVAVIATHDAELAARCTSTLRLLDGRVVTAPDYPTHE